MATLIEVLSQKQIFVSTSNTNSINPGWLNTYSVKGNQLNWSPNNTNTAWIKFEFITPLIFNSFTFSFSGLTTNFEVFTGVDNVNWNQIYSGTTSPTLQWNINTKFLLFQVNNPQSFLLKSFYIYATESRVFDIPFLSPYSEMLIPQSLYNNNPLYNTFHNAYLTMWEQNNSDSMLVMDPNYKLQLNIDIINNRIGGINSVQIDGEQI